MILKNPEEYGISSQRLLKMVQDMDASIEDMHTIGVICDNDVILLKCKEPYTEESRQMMHSFAKSMNSLAVGIAINQGRLHLEDKIVDYLGEYLPEKYDKRIEELTVRNLLTMAASSCRLSTYFRGIEESWIRHYFTFELPHDPGTYFQYDTGASYILSSLVTKTMGKTTLEVLNEYVFGPMGIQDVDWLVSPEGNTVGGWGLYLNTPDMAKIGILLANFGKYNGRQLVPKKYLEEAGSKQIQTPIEADNPYGYGYQFWIGPEESFCVFGAFGQCIIVNAQKKIAVIVTAGASDAAGNPNRKISAIANEELIIPTERKPLPENTEAFAKLKEYLEELKLPYAQGESKRAEKEKQFLGKRYVLEDNEAQIKAMRFDRRASDLLEIAFELSDKEITAVAGYKRWINQELVFDDVLHHSHSFSYAFENEDTLIIKQYLLNTSAFDQYVIHFGEDHMKGVLTTSVKLGGSKPIILNGACK